MRKQSKCNGSSLRVLRNESGFAMIWALVVILIILIAGAVVTKVTFDSFQRAKTRSLERRAWWLAQSGVNRLVTKLNTEAPEMKRLWEISILDSVSENERITSQLYPWGGMLLAVSTGNVGAVYVKTSAVIGQKSDLPDSVLVRTRHPEYPLVLAGSVNPQGKVVSLGGMPTSGLFEGRGPTQSRVDEWTLIPDTEPEEFTGEYLQAELEYHREVRTFLPVTYFGNQRFEDVDLRDVLDSGDLVVSGDLELIDCQLNAQYDLVRVFSDKTIRIAGDTRIEGRVALWAAKEIIIEDQTRIDGAAVISDSLIICRGESKSVASFLAGYQLSIEESAQFFWGASATTLIDESLDRKSPPTRSLSVTSTDSVFASLNSILIGHAEVKEYPRLFVLEDAKFSGLISANHFVELRSDGHMQVDALAFWQRKPPTTFLNWLVDRRLERLGFTVRPALVRDFRFERQ